MGKASQDIPKDSVIKPFLEAHKTEGHAVNLVY